LRSLCFVDVAGNFIDNRVGVRVTENVELNLAEGSRYNALEFLLVGMRVA